LKYSLGFIADLCEIYKKEIKPLLNVEILGGMVVKLKNYNIQKQNNNLKSLLAWSEDVNYQLFKLVGY